MAFRIGQFGYEDNDDNYTSAFGGNADSFSSLYGDQTTQALEANRSNQARARTALASGGLEQIGRWAQAKEYAQAYQEQVRRQERQERSRRRGGLFGGALNFLDTAASFIPVAGPVIGAGLKAAGGLFS